MYASLAQLSMMPRQEAIYYGAADSYVGLAFTEIDGIVEYIKNNSKLSESDKEIGRR